MAEGTEGVGHLKNVSRAGICVRSADLPRPGVAIALQFELPTTGALVNLRGEVRWSSDRLGSVGTQSGLRRDPARAAAAVPEFFLRWAIEQVEKEDEPA